MPRDGIENFIVTLGQAIEFNMSQGVLPWNLGPLLVRRLVHFISIMILNWRLETFLSNTIGIVSFFLYVNMKNESTVLQTEIVIWSHKISCDCDTCVLMQLFLWNMMFEWQTYLEAGDLPTPACSDLYYASEERAVSVVVLLPRQIIFHT